ncbi:hypothetical protein AYO49_01950 [Verrucomicrobiaceae bacterium SCGC AG-212-N21]|nr:hypothetical protein AYO49_01950 [Verrucomicrobiaceae bacterium SCGC AG-212-N21]
MNATLCILLFVALAHLACAQTLAPELAPLAAKYKADLATLEGQRTNALTQAQNPYTAALATAEKSATAAGNIAGTAVIAAERVGLAKGLLTPGFPPGMPKELQNPRKTYLDAVARIRAAEAPRRQTIDGAYLRTLTGLSAKAPKESELAKQIEAEKQKLIASAPPAVSKQIGKSMVVNGSFDVIGSNGLPAGWSTESDGCFKVSRDGTNSVLHASLKTVGYAAIKQEIPLPPKARSVTLSGRIRGKAGARKPGEVDFGGKILGNYLDANDLPTKDWVWFQAEPNEQWKTYNQTQKIPEGVKTFLVILEMKFAAGEFDFDDIAVEFR